jgi:hypothetical protein
VPGVFLLLNLLLSEMDCPVEPVLATARTPGAPFGLELSKHSIEATPAAGGLIPRQTNAAVNANPNVGGTAHRFSAELLTRD